MTRPSAVNRATAAIVYHFFPHYREGVIKALNASENWDYEWIGSDIDCFEGIEATREWQRGKYIDAPFWKIGHLIWQRKVVAYAVRTRSAAAIFLANPYYLSTWVAAIVFRLRRKRVLFWTHGWIANERGGKRLLRAAFLRLAHGLLLYGERARQIGLNQGFRRQNLHVIYNSLDYERQVAVRRDLLGRSLRSVRENALGDRLDQVDAPLIVCTARLTKSCRFELLIEALALLAAKEGVVVNVVLVGDGPERQRLESVAQERRVHVVFFGACYDEDVLGPIIYGSDITVSPGKIGLTAMHSLMYGTPVITHDRMDFQFPEVEAIESGRTGEFFKFGDPDSLAETIRTWLLKHPTKGQKMMEDCFRVMEDRYNPNVQRRLIESALGTELRHAGGRNL